MKDLSRRRGLSFEDVAVYTSAAALALFIIGMLGLIWWGAYQNTIGASCQ